MTNQLEGRTCETVLALGNDSEVECGEIATTWAWHEHILFESDLHPACGLHGNDAGREIAKLRTTIEMVRVEVDPDNQRAADHRHMVNETYSDQVVNSVRRALDDQFFWQKITQSDWEQQVLNSTNQELADANGANFLAELLQDSVRGKIRDRQNHNDTIARLQHWWRVGLAIQDFVGKAQRSGRKTIRIADMMEEIKTAADRPANKQTGN